LCSVNGYIDLFQNIWQGTDMILVSMGNYKSFNLFDIIFQISYIRDDQVDSQHIVLRERKTAVYHNNTVFVLKSCNIHSYLFQSAQRNDLQFSIMIFFQCYSSNNFRSYSNSMSSNMAAKTL